jgi:16S rRNA (guanine1207-N2)-methyltransferase
MSESISTPHNPLPPRIQELLLIACLADAKGERILGTTAGGWQFAVAAGSENPHALVYCPLLDLCQALQSAQRWKRQVKRTIGNIGSGTSQSLPALCDGLSRPEAGCVALPLSTNGEAELARDLLQSGHQQLSIDGLLLAATDNPRDVWLEQELRKLPGKLQRRGGREGVVYLLHKRGPLKKLENFACE